MNSTNDYISLYNKTNLQSLNTSNTIKPLSNNNKPLNLEDSELLKLSKEEILLSKNKTIDELTEMISYLVIENDKLKEKYAQSVSFFKNYISLLEKDKGNVLKSTETNTNSLSTTSHDKLGNFTRCEFCDEILPLEEVQSHVEYYTNGSQLAHDITAGDLLGVEEYIKHGIKASRFIIDVKTKESILFFIL